MSEYAQEAAEVFAPARACYKETEQDYEQRVRARLAEQDYCVAAEDLSLLAGDDAVHMCLAWQSAGGIDVSEVTSHSRPPNCLRCPHSSTVLSTARRVKSC